MTTDTSPHRRTFGIRVERQDGLVELRPKGDVDAAATPLLERTIARLFSDRLRRLTLDLRGVTFLDVAAVRLLVATVRAARWHGIPCPVVAPSPAVVHALRRTGAEREVFAN